MIKAIIFDIGGVLIDTDRLSKPVLDVFKPIDKDKFWEELNHKAIPLCRGEITLSDFWDKLAEGKDIPKEKLDGLWVRDFDKIANVDDEMIGLLSRLKKDYKLAIISNIIEEHAIVLREKGFFSYFDVVALSYELKMTKDDKGIFLHTLDKLHVHPNEAVFIDDIPMFVNTARSVGINAILFKNTGQLKTELKRLC